MRRWLAIDKALHFDILFIESIMQEQSHQHWIPSQKVCIDEGIGPWKGKNKGVKTYILGKPHPNGIKIYILADENNYVYDFWIYCGIQPSTAEIAANFLKKKKKKKNTTRCVSDHPPLSCPSYYSKSKQHAGEGYLITADACYGRLSTAKLLLELKHYFILSCKGNFTP